MSGVKRAVIEAYSPIYDVDPPISDEARALFFKFFPETPKGHAVSRTDNRVIDVNQNSGVETYLDLRYYLGRVMFESTTKRLGSKVAQVSESIAELLEEEMPTLEIIGEKFDSLATYKINNRRGDITNVLALRPERANADDEQGMYVPNFVKALQDALSHRTSPMLDTYRIVDDFAGAVPLIGNIPDSVLQSPKYPRFIKNLSEFLPVNGVIEVGGEVGSAGEGTPTVIETRS